MDRDPIDLTPAHHVGAPEKSQPNSHGWARADLVELIAQSLARSFTYMQTENCRPAADTLLRTFGAAGLKISSTKPPKRDG